jgi:hypothetical protein
LDQDSRWMIGQTAHADAGMRARWAGALAKGGGACRRGCSHAVAAGRREVR